MSAVCAAGFAPPCVAVNAIDVRETASAGDGGGEPLHVTGVVMSVPISAALSARS